MSRSRGASGAAVLVAGIVGGFALAHLVNSTPWGKEWFGRIRSGADAFGEAVREGYRARTEALLIALDDSAPDASLAASPAGIEDGSPGRLVVDDDF